MNALTACAVCTIAFAIVFVAAELCARLVLRRWGGWYRYPPYYRQRLEIDAHALPELSPIARISINADGERGDPPPGPRDDTYRALVVGGSAAECGLLDQSETISAVVQRMLRRPGNLAALGAPRVHVGCIARSILPCEAVQQMLEGVLPRYPRLDLVLVMVGASDVLRWMERGLPSPIPDGDVDPSSVFEHRPDGPWSFTPRRLALRRIAVTLYRRVYAPLTNVQRGGTWLDRVRRMRTEAAEVIDVTPDPTPLLDHFAKHLAALIHTARGDARRPCARPNGAALPAERTRVIVLRQPWLAGPLSPRDERLVWSFGLGRPYREPVTTYFSQRVIDELMRLVDARAAAVADALGVEHVDLMSRLPRAGTFYDHLHFTPDGARAVARIAVDAIVTPLEAPAESAA